MAKTQKTRVLVISDTHSAAQQATSSDFSFRPPFPKADVVLHTGDLTMIGTPAENQSALSLLKSLNAELKIVIAGNHDLTLDKNFYLNAKTDRFSGNKSSTLQGKMFHGQDYNPADADLVQNLWTSQEAKDAGVQYLEEGTHTFSLSNGAQFKVYASAWQPEFFNWAFNYRHEEDRWNPHEMVESVPFAKNVNKKVVPVADARPIPAGVDIVLTHGPPWMHLDECQPSGFRAGCPQLLQAIERVRPRLHCFGHIHEGWGAERITWKSRKGRDAGKLVELGEEGKIEEDVETLGALQKTSPSVQSPMDQEVINRRAALLDMSQSGTKPLRTGEETILINSSIMTLKYEPDNAGWLIDLDLPKSL